MPDAFRVLLVDDSETATEMLSWLLGSAGYAVETAGDGVKGVRAAFRRVPDLVVMSTRLPRLDGIQACRLLKADPATRDVPVILLTSEEAGADRLHAAHAGADRCLLRDVSPEEALPAVRECLAGKAPRPEGGPGAGVAAPDDIDILSRVNGVLEATLFEASLLNEIAHVGREVDDFEATARKLFRLLREIAPAEAMGAVFSDGVFSEGVSVFPDDAGDPFREEVRHRTERLRDEAGVPFSPDRAVWTGIQGGFPGSDVVAPGSLVPRAVCTVRAGEMVKGLMAVYSGVEGAAPGGAATKETLLRQAFMVLENAWLYRQIARISVTDGLTGLTNVRHFREQVAAGAFPRPTPQRSVHHPDDGYRPFQEDQRRLRPSRGRHGPAGDGRDLPGGGPRSPTFPPGTAARSSSSSSPGPGFPRRSSWENGSGRRWSGRCSRRRRRCSAAP